MNMNAMNSTYINRFSVLPTTPLPSTFVSYPVWAIIILWLLTCIFCVVTTLGNLLVLLAYKLERNIRRQLSNKFIVSLAVSDLIIGMEGFPMLTVYVVEREHWPLGALLCRMWLCVDYTLCLVSILTVLLITVDRYCSVCYPARYRAWQTRKKVRAMIVLSWTVPLVLFAVMIFGWELITTTKVDNQTVKELDKCSAPFLSDPYVNMCMYIAYYWTTLLAMSVLYRGIHKAAKALERKSKAREKQTIALLLGQRCMAQVGVGILMRVEPQNGKSESNKGQQQQKIKKDKIELSKCRRDSAMMVEDPMVVKNSAQSDLTKRENVEETVDTDKLLEKLDRVLIKDEKEKEEEIIKLSKNELLDENNDEEIVNLKTDETRSLLLDDSINFVDNNKKFDDDDNDVYCSKNIRSSKNNDNIPKKSLSFCKKSQSKYSLRKKRKDSFSSLNTYGSSADGNNLYNDLSFASLFNFRQTVSFQKTDTEETLEKLKQDRRDDILNDYLKKSVTFEKCLGPDDDDEKNNAKNNYGTYRPYPSLIEPDSTQISKQTPTKENCPKLSSSSNNLNVSDNLTRRMSSSTTVPVAINHSPLSDGNKCEEFRRVSMSWEDVKTVRKNWTSMLHNAEEKLSEKSREYSETNFLNDEEEKEERTVIVEKRAGSWVSSLFTNPVWLFNKKRKVTKAEKRARKAFRTITVIVGTFALFWSPYFIVATVYGFCPSCVPTALFFTSYYLCYLNSSVNPFAYAFANRLFRKTFVRILRGDFHRT